MSDDEFFSKEAKKKPFLSSHRKYEAGINNDTETTDRRNLFSLNNDYRDSIYSDKSEPHYLRGDHDAHNAPAGVDDDSDDDAESVLSEISNESMYFENKVGYQKRALFRKNMTLQLR